MRIWHQLFSCSMGESYASENARQARRVKTVAVESTSHILWDPACLADVLGFLQASYVDVVFADGVFGNALFGMQTCKEVYYPTTL